METLLMSGRERHRMELLSRVQCGGLTLVKGAELMGVSYRQAKRIYVRYRSEGDAGVVHRLRGRSSNRRSDPVKRARVLELYRARYDDFGPTLAVEYLQREDGLSVPVETLRRWLIQEGLWHRRRKRSAHRRWRARKEHFGEMLQMDGSHHDWFEGRREQAVLMVIIDDASSHTYARFFEGETTAAAFETFRRYVEQYGLPQSLYVDKDSIYRTTRDATVDELLADEPPLTQFGRAMQDLDVKLILAHSPQAKGRVERRNGVFQDRLVKALRLAEISDLDAANGFLETVFLPELNERFTVEPARGADLHRRVPRGVDLGLVLSFQELRVVQNDWTVRWQNRRFQLTEANRKLALVRQRVLICEGWDGTIRLRYKNRELPWEELPAASAAPPRPTSAGNGRANGSPPSAPARTPWKPAADHPWRKPFLAPRTAASEGGAARRGG